METIDDVIDKTGSIKHLWKVIDPENKYSYETCLKEWYRLSLVEQRRLYLYLLYRKWRGEGFYGSPYEIIANCHPYPTNWNGKPLINRLIKEAKMVSAKQRWLLWLLHPRRGESVEHDQRQTPELTFVHCVGW